MINTINNLSKINKIRKYIDISLLFILFCAIFALFYIKFQFENHQQKLTLINEEIYKYQNKSNLLDAELVYLSRPARLIKISQKYLKDIHHIDIAQIKDYEVLKKYYLVNLEKYHKNKIALK